MNHDSSQQAATTKAAGNQLVSEQALRLRAILLAYATTADDVDATC